MAQDKGFESNGGSKKLELLGMPPDKFKKIISDFNDELTKYQLDIAYFCAESNDPLTIYWYQKVLEKEPKNVIALYGVASCYSNGIGITVDYAKAVEYYKKAADLGDAAAENNLGSCYKNGYGGLEKNNKEAFSWYQKAANKGYREAQKNLGICYENGYGVEISITKAKKCYQKAANKGDESAKSSLNRLQIQEKSSVKISGSVIRTSASFESEPTSRITAVKYTATFIETMID